METTTFNAQKAPFTACHIEKSPSGDELSILEGTKLGRRVSTYNISTFLIGLITQYPKFYENKR